MQQALPWISALGVLVVIAAGLAFWATRPRQSTSLPLPNEWAVAPRAIFSVDERRAYRHLRDAFPEHVVLAKLPLIRMCQPVDPKEIRYWFELLGSIHVSYAICTAQGRVLAAIDLDGERPASRRTQQIKQGVLSTCRIRHLRCTLEHMPTAQELQRLLPPPGIDLEAVEPPTSPRAAPVRDRDLPGPLQGEYRQAFPTTLTSADLELGSPPASGFFPAPAAPRSAATTPQRPSSAAPPAMPVVTPVVRHPAQAEPAPPVPAAMPAERASPAGKSADAKLRKERKPLWQDSGLFQDSFFGIDNLRDAAPPSSFGSLLSDSARGRGTTQGPQISADPSQGMLESERAKLMQQGKR
jgi:Protein of unknown function (DUF2726)